MAKIRRIRIKHRPHSAMQPGSSPGAMQLPFGALEPVIKLYSYDDEEYHVTPIDGIAALEKHLEKFGSLTNWIEVKGVGDLRLFEFIEKKFGIHKLVLEDMVTGLQRPKLDEYDDYVFGVSRMLYLTGELEVENEQMSFLVTKNVLITFQETYEDFSAPVIDRLAGGRGNIRSGGPSYMMYALMDLILDNYFALIYRLAEELETMEELLYRKRGSWPTHDIQHIKRALILIRRSAWPERDKINDMIRSDSRLITKETRTFLRDAYDHCMQVIDLVESYRDITTSLMDMNISFQSKRMNEIMKVLTVISSIFIPLTFIAGVYGMNFAYQDPETGKILPGNMPELYAENGYFYTMLVMALIAILQLVWFWWKGWLSNR